MAQRGLVKARRSSELYHRQQVQPLRSEKEGLVEKREVREEPYTGIVSLHRLPPTVLFRNPRSFHSCRTRWLTETHNIHIDAYNFHTNVYNIHTSAYNIHPSGVEHHRVGLVQRLPPGVDLTQADGVDATQARRQGGRRRAG
eukprot:1184516-Prorocentrum_minimum.AAC.4